MYIYICIRTHTHIYIYNVYICISAERAQPIEEHVRLLSHDLFRWHLNDIIVIVQIPSGQNAIIAKRRNIRRQQGQYNYKKKREELQLIKFAVVCINRYKYRRIWAHVHTHMRIYAHICVWRAPVRKPLLCKADVVAVPVRAAMTHNRKQIKHCAIFCALCREGGEAVTTCEREGREKAETEKVEEGEKQ